jgi:multidrug resistance efflux pump
VKQIRKKKRIYHLPVDVRQEQLRFGKYLYLFILTVVILILIHILFGYLYLLKGKGFVYSTNGAVELEFDATIQKIYVKEGEHVKEGQLLFTFKSLEIDRALNDFIVNLHDTENELRQNEAAKLSTMRSLGSAEKYSEYTKNLHVKLNELTKRGIVSILNVSPEAKRNFDAEQDFIFYNKELARLGEEQDLLDQRLKTIKGRYDNLLSYYNDGNVYSRFSGVISDITIIPGQVLIKAAPAMKIFFGKRYVFAYFNQRSWVQYSKGDYLFVQVPKHGTLEGEIVKLLPITDRLPEEFQPRFKEKLRRQLVVIKLPEELLDSIPILTTVEIIKPLGYELFRKYILNKPSSDDDEEEDNNE